MMRALVVLCLAVFGGSAAAQSLTLSPAVVPLSGRAGQTTSQHFTLFNGTTQALRFRLVAKDVTVRNGGRVFVDAGELPGSVAATARFSTHTISLPPGEEGSVEVTLTLPARMTSRAVVILFQGTTHLPGNATVSLGSLLTFDLTGRVSIAAAELHAEPATASSNAALSIPVVNDGSEPAIVRGAAAIISGSGAIIAKVTFDAHRLLPGEQTALHTDYPGELPRGRYRVVATIESAQRSWTRSTELWVP
jgi:hypothetical protein